MSQLPEVLPPSEPIEVSPVVTCFVGSSLVAGVGDPKALGWVGRVVARSMLPELAITAYNLGVRDRSTADVLASWRAETDPRWRPDAARRLVLQVGRTDLQRGISTARTRLNLANVLDDAAADGIRCFVVGVTPVLEPADNDRLQALSDAQADVCGRRQVPYVDCVRPLRGHDQWASDLASSDGVHPGQAGYGLIAWLVLHHGWADWLGTPES